MSMTITLKDHPAVKRLILAADSSYKKHQATIVSNRATCELQGTYWDGGSRNTYTAVDMLTYRSQGAPQFNPPQFGGPRTAPVVDIPLNVCIVRTGTFCGKTSCATVYLHPENATKLIPNLA